MTDIPPPQPPEEEPAPEEPGDGVQVIEIQEEMERSFLDYAMSVIVSRALPDARDGLKPVHRRILWSMYVQGFRPDRNHVKCARTTGHVVANYHPHGTSSVYDALARMAQPFSLRDPLIDFHGNYGSPEFPPAAERYTEARLSPLAMRMLAGIDEDTVDMVANYDGKDEEPIVLPARFPNLLVNGSQGIAVGMATNIPPHNLGEAVDAVVHLIEHAAATPDDLMEIDKGPDFPTGGLIVGRGGIREAYETGRGRVVVRGRAHIEPMERGKERIIVTEMPFQVYKGDGRGDGSGLMQKIVEQVHSGRLKEISDLRDESDKSGIRLVVELKRDAIPKVVLNKLYKHTQLQTTFGVNMVALVDGVPRTLGLLPIVKNYVDHQTDIIVRRTKYELREREARLHVLEGYLIALAELDEVINLIRSSRDPETARDTLME